MYKFVELLITFVFIACGSACDPRERYYINIEKISRNILVHSFDQEYFSQMGNSNFKLETLKHYLNYTYDTNGALPFIINVVSFRSFVLKNVKDPEGTGFCGLTSRFLVATLVTDDYGVDLENYSMILYGCDVKTNLDVKVFIVSPSYRTKLDQLELNFNKINRNFSSAFCKCNESYTHIDECLKGMKTKDASYMDFAGFILFGACILAFLMIAACYNFLKKE